MNIKLCLLRCATSMDLAFPLPLDHLFNFSKPFKLTINNKYISHEKWFLLTKQW